MAASSAAMTNYESDMALNSVAVIGFGEVGQTLTKNFRDDGIKNVTAWDIAFANPSSAQFVAAKKAGITIAKSMGEALRGQSLVIACVTAGSAEAAAKQDAACLDTGALYADVNSISPGAKQRISKLVEAKGARFVEVTIMSPASGRRTAPARRKYSAEIPLMMQPKRTLRPFAAARPCGMRIAIAASIMIPMPAPK